MLPAQQQQQSMTHNGLVGVGGSVTLCIVVRPLGDDSRGVSTIAADCDVSAAVDRELAGLCRCDHVRAVVDDDPCWSTSNPRKGNFSPEDWAAVADVVDGWASVKPRRPGPAVPPSLLVQPASRV